MTLKLTLATLAVIAAIATALPVHEEMLSRQTRSTGSQSTTDYTLWRSLTTSLYSMTRLLQSVTIPDVSLQSYVRLKVEFILALVKFEIL